MVILIWDTCGESLVYQDLFVSRITKKVSQKKVLQRKQKRGWFTKEQMNTTLGWSLSMSQMFFDLGPSHHFPSICPPCFLFGIAAFLLLPCPLNQPVVRSYIKGAVQYCEKPGNERLWKNLILPLVPEDFVDFVDFVLPT